jgi:hypothetical protein
MPANLTLKHCLRWAVVRVYISAPLAFLARILWRYNYKESPSPTLLVAELTFQFSPSLDPDGLVESGLGLYVTSRVINNTFC